MPCIPSFASDEIAKISVCQLKSAPDAYNHKLVEVTGFVSHGFEDFTLFDPKCGRWPHIWLEYGGTAKSDTTYCCGPTAGKTRPQSLVIEHVPVPLVMNDIFKKFDHAIQPPFKSGQHDATVHATLIGIFFAGERQKLRKGKVMFMGYGHMGCCSLLAIQEVKSADTQQRADLD
jgi:hypothetical protein